VSVASQAVALLMWLINGHFSWQILVLFITLATFLTYYFRWRRDDLKPITIINRHDIFSIVVAAVSVGIIVAGALIGGHPFQQLIRFTFQGYDNTAHIATIMADYSQSGYVYGTDKAVLNVTVFNGIGAYPQGWHLFTATLFHGYSNHLQILKSFETILALLFSVVMFWYLILIFLATRFMLYIVDWFANVRNNKVTTYTAVASASVLFQILGGLQAVKFGFINYLGVVVYLIVLVMLGLWALHKKANSKLSTTSFVIYGSLLATGATMTWVLPAPIAFLFILLVVLCQFSSFKKFIAWLKSNIPTIIVTLILVGLSALQIWIHVVFGQGTDDINATGPGWYVGYLLLLLVGTVVVWWALSRNKREVNFTKFTFITILSFGITAALIYIYQMASVQTTNYYYNKTAALLILVLVIILGGIGALLVEKLSKKIGIFLACFVAIAAAAIVPFATNADVGDISFAVGGMRSITPDTATKMVDIIHKDNSVNYGTLIVMPENGTNEDLIATHPMSLLFRGDLACTKSVLDALYYTTQDQVRQLVINCATANPNKFYFVLPSPTNRDDLVKLYKDYSNIKVLE